MSRHFNGTTDGLLNSNATALDGVAAVSLFAWLAPEKTGTQTIIRFGDPGSAPFVNWGFASASGKIEGQYAIAGTLFRLDSTTSHPTDGTWIAVGLTVTSGTQHLYYSGSSQASGSASGTVQNLSDNRFAVGYSPAFGEHYEGRVAHVAVWNVALSAADMADLAAGANPLAIQPDNLIGYWPLAGTDSPEPDEVGATALTVTGTTEGTDPPGVDAPPGGTDFTNAEDDSATVTDATAIAVSLTLTDSIASTDSIAHTGSVSLTQDIDDSLAGTDATSAAVGLTKSDTIEVSDTAGGGGTSASLSFAETLDVSDAVDTGASTAYTKSLDDSIAGTDAVAKAAQTEIEDTVAAADAPALTYGLALSDTGSLADSRIRVWTAERVIADTASVTDLLDTGGSVAHTKTLADALRGADAISKAPALTHADAAAISDSRAFAIGLLRADIGSLADARARAWVARHTVADALTITDHITLPDVDIVQPRTTVPAASRTLSSVPPRTLSPVQPRTGVSS